MKYLYKHGNQFWYQRAVPKKIIEIIGIKSIKVSLKTNKIQTAIQRSKLQALEHRKMFNQLLKKNRKFLFGFRNEKKIDIKNYEIKFLDEYEDLVSDFFFSSKKRLNKNPLDNSGSIENYFFKIQNSIPLLSVYFKKYFLQEYDFKTNDLLKFNQSLKFLIDECGDKPLNKYDLNDLKVLNQTISQNLKFTKNLGYLSKVFLTASKQFDLNNSFDINSLKIKKTDNKNKYNLILSSDNLKKLSEYCKKAESIESQVLGIIINTGCSLKEILGLEYNDIYIDRFQSFIAIRSNSLRKIKNINKIRTIPLIGVSLICGKYFFKTLINCKNNLVFEGEFDKLENSIKRILKKNTNSKSIMSLQKTLIARLLHINCPEEVILDLIGRSRKNSLYNREISLDIKKSWLEHLEYF